MWHNNSPPDHNHYIAKQCIEFPLLRLIASIQFSRYIALQILTHIFNDILYYITFAGSLAKWYTSSSLSLLEISLGVISRSRSLISGPDGTIADGLRGKIYEEQRICHVNVLDSLPICVCADTIIQSFEEIKREPHLHVVAPHCIRQIDTVFDLQSHVGMLGPVFN